MRGKPYTPEEIDIVRDLLATGHTLREVADVIGRSYPSARTLASKHGLKALAEAGKRARAEGLRAAVRSNPQFRAHLVAQCRKNARENIEKRPDMLRAAGKRQTAVLTDPELRQRSNPARLAGLRRHHANRMAWLPDRWRDEYARWRDNYGAAMAKEMVLDAERQRVAKLSDFERQLERVAAGARVIERPVIRQREASHSLTGSSMAQIV